MHAHHHHQEEPETFEEFEDDTDLRPSKSQKKRDMQALRDMGEELVLLPAARLKKIPMPENLLGALLEWQRLTKHQARGRQMQYIGKLLRDVDLAPLQEVLDIVKGVSVAETARIHRLEQMRTRLLEDEQVLGEIASDYPGADLQHLRQLRRNALKEQELQKPPRAFREIFQVLKSLEARAGEEAGFGEPEGGEDFRDDPEDH